MISNAINSMQGMTPGSGAGALPALQPATAPAATGSQSGTTSSSGTAGSSDAAGTDTFLKLLVAQMRNQDPMQPMDDQSFITELAQFNTVEQMLNLKQSVEGALAAQQANEGVGLLGKTVTYTVPGIGQASSSVGQGVVSGVSLQDGQVQLQVNQQTVPLSEVTAVSA